MPSFVHTIMNGSDHKKKRTWWWEDSLSRGFENCVALASRHKKEEILLLKKGGAQNYHFLYLELYPLLGQDRQSELILCVSKSPQNSK